MNHPASSHKNGFTLVEVLVSVAIIAILAGVFLANVNGAQSKTRDVVRMKNFESVYTALYMFYLDHKYYPITHWNVFHDDLFGEGPSDPLLRNQGLQYYLNGPGGKYLAGNPVVFDDSWYYHLYPYNDARGFVLCVYFENTGYAVQYSRMTNQDLVPDAEDYFAVNPGNGGHNFGTRGDNDSIVYCRGRWFKR